MNIEQKTHNDLRERMERIHLNKITEKQADELINLILDEVKEAVLNTYPKCYERNMNTDTANTVRTALKAIDTLRGEHDSSR